MDDRGQYSIISQHSSRVVLPVQGPQVAIQSPVLVGRCCPRLGLLDHLNPGDDISLKAKPDKIIYYPLEGTVTTDYLIIPLYKQ